MGEKTFWFIGYGARLPETLAETQMMELDTVIFRGEGVFGSVSLRTHTLADPYLVIPLGSSNLAALEGYADLSFVDVAPVDSLASHWRAAIGQERLARAERDWPRVHAAVQEHLGITLNAGQLLFIQDWGH